MSLYFVFVSQFTCLSAKTTGIDPACRKLSGDLLDVHAVWRCKSANLAYFGLELECFEPYGQSTANSNSFKIAQKTAFEVKG